MQQIENRRTTQSITDAFGFTIREKEIFRLMLSGTGDVAIAQELRISETAVKSSCRKMMHKLGASSRDEIIQKAEQWDLAVSRLLG